MPNIRKLLTNTKKLRLKSRKRKSDKTISKMEKDLSKLTGIADIRYMRNPKSKRFYTETYKGFIYGITEKKFRDETTGKSGVKKVVFVTDK